MFGYIYETGAAFTRRACHGAMQLATQAVERLPAVPEVLKDNTITRFAGSVIGRMLVRSQTENLAECAGYFGSVSLAAPASSHIGRTISRLFIAKTAPFWSRITASGTLAQILYNHFRHGRFNTTIVSMAQIAALTMTFFASDAAIALGDSERIESYLTNYEENIGNVAIEYGFGILAAFMAMKLTNTTEVFWDSENIAQTYPFKTIQSMLFCSFLDQMNVMPSNPTIHTAVALLCGSLAYNLLDIANFSSAAIKGTLLNERLPNYQKANLQLIDEGSIFQTLSSTVEFVSKNHQKLAQGRMGEIGVNSLKKQTKARIWSSLRARQPELAHRIEQANETVANLTNLSKIIEQKRSKLSENPLIAKLFEITTLQFMENQQMAGRLRETGAVEKLNEILSDKGSITFIRAANLYFHLLSIHPQFFHHLSRTWNEEYRDEESSLRRAEMFREISNNEEIREQITHYLDDDQTPISLQGKLRIIEETIPSISRRKMRTAAEWMIERLKRLEREMVGTDLSSREQTAIQTAILEGHIEKIYALTPLFAPSSLLHSLEEAELRQFYVHISKAGKEHYSNILSRALAMILQKFIEKQLQYSTFQLQGNLA